MHSFTLVDSLIIFIITPGPGFLRFLSFNLFLNTLLRSQNLRATSADDLFSILSPFREYCRCWVICKWPLVSPRFKPAVTVSKLTRPRIFQLMFADFSTHFLQSFFNRLRIFLTYFCGYFHYFYSRRVCVELSYP